MLWDHVVFHVTNAIRPSETKPCVFSFCSSSFFFVLSQQQEHIATRLHCSRFSVEKNKSYELILYNEQKSNRYLQQMF